MVARPLKFDPQVALENAMNVFWRQGYEATSLDDLTEAMGINRPSLYNTFGSKHDLYLAALKRYRELYSHQMIAALEAQSGLREALSGAFTAIIRSETGSGCMMVNTITETLPHDDSVAAFIQAADAETETAFAIAIARAQDRGEIDTDKNPDLLARYLNMVLQGLRVRSKSGCCSGELEHLLPIILSVLD
ncbi:MAG: TetR/AcrR family transcriptional regulator [Deinococcota bacterium]